MNKRNLTIVLIVFIAVIAVFSAKIVTGRGIENKQEETSASLDDQFQKLINSSKPSIIIFSYDADCCESTKQFFNQYNTKAKSIMKDYGSKFETLFINTGALKDEKDENILMKIAGDYEVKQLPSVLILDARDKRVKVIEGVFDENEIRKMLDEVVKK